MKPIIPVMRTALEQIQELHPLSPVGSWCEKCFEDFPCKTRKLAVAGLTDRMARTNRGENK